MQFVIIHCLQHINLLAEIFHFTLGGFKKQKCWILISSHCFPIPLPYGRYQKKFRPLGHLEGLPLAPLKTSTKLLRQLLWLFGTSIVQPRPLLSGTPPPSRVLGNIYHLSTVVAPIENLTLNCTVLYSTQCFTLKGNLSRLPLSQNTSGLQNISTLIW